MFEKAFRTLRVAENASPEEIRQVYVRQVRRYPPENFPEKFREIRSAYDSLRLEDDVIERILEGDRHGVDGMPQLAALLWGERAEAYPVQKDVDFLSLVAVAEAPERKREMLDMLSAAAAEGLVWQEGGEL